MIRIIFLLTVLGLAFFLIRFIVLSILPHNCEHCKGEGNWKGTRGERNFCHACNGTGHK